MKKMNWKEFSEKYLGPGKNTSARVSQEIDLIFSLQKQKEETQPTGWMLFECQDMSSSHMGETWILPYGPQNGYKEIPQHPVSLRGLASDMAIVIGILAPEDIPLEV